MRRIAPAVAALLAACSVDIQHGLDEVEANQIVVVLDRAGIPSTKRREEGRTPTWKVRVASSEATRAWQVLRENELPRGRAKGFEVFSKGGLIPTQTEERALYQQALSGEITKMLLSYPRVIDARVLVSVPRDRSFGSAAGTPRPSASVLVKHADPGTPFPSGDVQRLVAGAVPGLTAQDVTVVATAAPVSAPADSGMAQLGPFVVSRGSYDGLWVALVAGAALIVALGAALVLGVVHLRRMRARLRDLESPRAPAE
jgi:type III secretion system YscJ/HrcJ family lipoprotein